MPGLKEITQEEKVKHTLLDSIIPQKAMITVPETYILRLELISKQARELIKNPTDSELKSLISIANKLKRNSDFWSWLSENTQIDELLEIAHDKDGRKELLSVISDASKGKLPEGLEGLKEQMTDILGPESTLETIGKYSLAIVFSPLILLSQLSCSSHTEDEYDQEDAGYQEAPDVADAGAKELDITKLKPRPVDRLEDAGVTDAGLQMTQFRMEELPVHTNIAFSLVNVPDDIPLLVEDDKGNVKSISGQMLFAEANTEVRLTNRRIDVGDRSNTMFFYDPESKDVYYYDGDASFYDNDGGFTKADPEPRYKLATVADVTFIENSAETSIDLDAEFRLASEVSGIIGNIRQNYKDWLNDGMASIGIDADLADYVDIAAVDKVLEDVKVVIHRSGSFGRAEFPYILISDKNIDPAIREQGFMHTVMHEHFHMIFNAIAQTNGSLGKEFYIKHNPSLMEGSTEFLTRVAVLSAPEFGPAPLMYAPAVEMNLLLLNSLGADRYFNIMLTTGVMDADAELSSILSRPYSDMSRAYSISSAMLQSTYESVAILNTVRMLGEMQSSDAMGFDEMLQKHEASMQALYSGVPLRPGLERYGLDERPILEQSYHGSRGINWNTRSTRAYDVRTAASDAMGSDLVNIATRYRNHFLLLNSMDYENYDIESQQIAAGVIMNMLEDFASYWNGISSEERLSPLPQREGAFLYNACYALSARYGIDLASVLVDAFEVMGTDQEMAIPKSPHVLPFSSIDLDIPESLDINSMIDTGTATITLSEPWSDSMNFKTEGNVENIMRKDANKEIIIEFSNGAMSVSGLSVDVSEAE